MQIYLDERAKDYGVDILVSVDEVNTPTKGEPIRNEYWAVDKHNGMLHIYYFEGIMYPQCNEDSDTAYSNSLVAYGLSVTSKQIEEVYVGEELEKKIDALIESYDKSKVVALTPGTM